MARRLPIGAEAGDSGTLRLRSSPAKEVWSWLPNTLAWVAVVVGSFALNLLLLVLITGG